MKAFLIILSVIVLIVLIICIYVLSYLSRRKMYYVPNFILKAVMGVIAGNDDMSDSYWQDARKREKWLALHCDEHFTIKNKKRMNLKAKVFLSDVESKVFVLACHGCRSSGIGEFAFISQYIHRKNFNLFLVDHRACGDSDGKYMGYGLYESKDTMLWIDFIKEKYGDDVEIILYGVSMGGATVLMMSGMNLPANVKGIVSDCSYTSAWDEFAYQIKTSFHISKFPLLYIIDGLSVVLAGYSFKWASPIKALKKAKLPILFIHGAKDDYVPKYMVQDLFNACPTEKYMLVVPDATHAKSYQTHPEMYEEELNGFFEKIL